MHPVRLSTRANNPHALTARLPLWRRRSSLSGMPSPAPPWREYQREAAEFFESLGFVATVDAPVQGVRSRHDIDVLVEFEAFGVDHRWLVECKAWNRPVPKERVEVLKS